MTQSPDQSTAPGNLDVPGQSIQKVDYENNDRGWRIIAGSPTSDEPETRVFLTERPDGNVDLSYELSTNSPRRLLQTLRFMPDTWTLENLEGQRPRCIMLWRCRQTQKKFIFAMRRAVDPETQAGPDLAPFEGPNQNGTWGGEDEGGGGGLG